ncbi:hypothetical protein INT45_000730 [Circinella minor]|uniref:Uncharacterized protein n=1 Tax=Circinella minor TaxID=1195481 RepID=A0A8H7RHE1_9FUNG|nr:hypothetical protein INT45_000730 [Circinella minor]
MDPTTINTFNQIVQQVVLLDNKIQRDCDEEKRSARSLLHIAKKIRARESYKAGKRNGSGRFVPGRKYTDRKRRIFAKHLEDDYLDDEKSTCDNNAFRRRFRIEKKLFLMIPNELKENYRWFQQKHDAAHKLEFNHYFAKSMCSN